MTVKTFLACTAAALLVLALGMAGPAKPPRLAAEEPFGRLATEYTKEVRPLLQRYCARCHTMGRGLLPDLRRLKPELHAIFPDIVLKGALQPLGMGRFDDVLSLEDVSCIHAFLIDQAWVAFEAQNKKR